ncbi:MAG: hypothetical protein Q9174_005989, partial [Haloplaca sp. 1 TL-2023]
LLRIDNHAYLGNTTEDSGLSPSAAQEGDSGQNPPISISGGSGPSTEYLASDEEEVQEFTPKVDKGKQREVTENPVNAAGDPPLNIVEDQSSGTFEFTSVDHTKIQDDSITHAFFYGHFDNVELASGNIFPDNSVA